MRSKETMEITFGQKYQFGLVLAFTILWNFYTSLLVNSFLANPRNSYMVYFLHIMAFMQVEVLRKLASDYKTIHGMSKMPIDLHTLMLQFKLHALIASSFTISAWPWLAAFIWAVWPTNKSLIDPIAGNVTGKGYRSSGDTIGSRAPNISVE